MCECVVCMCVCMCVCNWITVLYTWNKHNIINQFYLKRDFTCGAVVKNTPANAGDTGDLGSIPGSGRSHGEGNGNLLQYSCLGNLMDRGTWQATVHGVAKNWKWQSDWACTHTHTHTYFNIPPKLKCIYPSKKLYHNL